MSSATSESPANIAELLRASAAAHPFQRAVVVPVQKKPDGLYTYSQWTFQQLDQESDRLARGLQELGVQKGTRLVLMVPPTLEFFGLTFALFKVGAVAVLIDPGMGRSKIFRCLEQVQPEGFIAIPLVHWIRRLYRRRFRNARFLVSVGRFAPGAVPYDRVIGGRWDGPFPIAPTDPQDTAAIIFTSGSTGPPKGVVYEHGMFAAQVRMLREHFEIQPGEIDLAAFPLFALFNAAMSVTTVIPDMNPTRPADIDPTRVIRNMYDHGVTQAFGSPALWDKMSRWCEETGIDLPLSLRRVLSAGAPVPVPVLERMQAALSAEGAAVYTPYGATESLPVAEISSREVLGETAAASADGAGTCVGRPFSEVSVKIIPISDEPIANIDDVTELPAGEIGEIVVRGPSTTREYYRDPEATRAAKISDSDGGIWHRMGDVGYFDEQGRLWYCGRKSHIVWTADGPMYTVPCETIINQHPLIYRSALVGVGPRGQQTPVLMIQPEKSADLRVEADAQKLIREALKLAAQHSKTAAIKHCYLHLVFPVDVRHNSKIFREELAAWAAEQFERFPPELEEPFEE